MTQCCVPFCKNKSRKNYSSYVCSVHWKLVDKSIKRIYRRGWRRWDRDKSEVAILIINGAYRRARKQAIERGAGI